MLTSTINITHKEEQKRVYFAVTHLLLFYTVCACSGNFGCHRQPRGPTRMISVLVTAAVCEVGHCAVGKLDAEKRCPVRREGPHDGWEVALVESTDPELAVGLSPGVADPEPCRNVSKRTTKWEPTPKKRTKGKRKEKKMETLGRNRTILPVCSRQPPPPPACRPPSGGETTTTTTTL